MNVIKKICSLASILLLIQACASTAPVSVFHRFDELEISRDFTSKTISSRPFVVNVIGLDQDDSTLDSSISSSQASNLLTENFQSIRPDLNLQKPSFSAAEKKDLTQILKTFAVQQEFPREGYTYLQKTSLANSWFLIADLENMRIEHDLTEEDLKDRNGKKIDTQYSYRTSRNLSVRYFIYDPKARHLVFTGLIRSTTQAIHDRVGRANDADYPEAPGMSKSLSQNFQNFLRALPATQGN